MLQPYVRRVETGYLQETPAGQYVATVTEIFYIDSAGVETHQQTATEVATPVRRGRRLRFDNGDLAAIGKAIDTHASLSLATKGAAA